MPAPIASKTATGLPIARDSTSVITSSTRSPAFEASPSGASSVTITRPSTAFNFIPSISAFGTAFGHAIVETFVSPVGVSPVVTGIVIERPARHTLSCTTCPTFFRMISLGKSFATAIATPSTCVITSVGRRSLLKAGESASIVCTYTPEPMTCKCSRIAGRSASDSTRTPMYERRTFPSAINCRDTSRIIALGIANDSPRPSPLISVFIPTIFPSTSKSGPPEFPGLIDASVWM